MEVKLEDLNQRDLVQFCKKKAIPGYSVKIDGKSPNKDQLIQRIKDFMGTATVEADTKAEAEVKVESAAEAVKDAKVTKSVDILEFLGLTEEQIKEVKEASQNANLPVVEIIKSGLMLKAKKINSEFKKLENLSPVEIKNSTLIGSANKNIEQVVNNIVAWNNAQYNNDLRVYICASIVRNLTGSNLHTIQRFLDNYRTNDSEIETIEEHNQRYGLTERDNKKGRDANKNRIKISDLIRNVQPVQPKVEPKPVELKTETTKDVANMNPVEFAAYVDSLEDENSIKSACILLTNQLREHLKTKETPKEQAVALHNELQKYRKNIRELKLKSFASYPHFYGTPRTLKDGESLPKGAVQMEDGRIESVPQHIALKYLVLTQEENDLRN